MLPWARGKVGCTCFDRYFKSSYGEVVKIWLSDDYRVGVNL